MKRYGAVWKRDADGTWTWTLCEQFHLKYWRFGEKTHQCLVYARAPGAESEEEGARRVADALRALTLASPAAPIDGHELRRTKNGTRRE